MVYYGNNDYRDYLAHYGIKGMKWGKHLFGLDNRWNYGVNNKIYDENKKYYAGTAKYGDGFIRRKNNNEKSYTENTSNIRTAAGKNLRKAQALRVQYKEWMDKGDNRQSGIGRWASKRAAEYRSEATKAQKTYNKSAYGRINKASRDFVKAKKAVSRVLSRAKKRVVSFGSSTINKGRRLINRFFGR